jgi:hypothetical protein
MTQKTNHNVEPTLPLIALTIAIGGKISKIRIFLEFSKFLANCIFWVLWKVEFNCPNFGLHGAKK